MIDEDVVRAIALSLPETIERPSYGMAGFRVRHRLFARIREDGGSVVVWCADEAEKGAPRGRRAGKVFTTAHYYGHPMLCVRFDGIDAAELTELLTESWRLRAPARLRSRFDAERDTD